MQCSKKDTCVNYRIRCFNCGAMADIFNPYPRYVDKEEQKRRLRILLVNKPDLFLSNEQLFALVDYLVENGVVVREV